MRNMRFKKMSNGGYLTPLEKTRPELASTIKNYRQRLTDAEKTTFDKRANMQFAATQNMPKAERTAYISSIEKQFAKPSDAQFEKIRADLKTKKFRPQYRFATSEPTAKKTGFYRDFSPDIKKLQDEMSKLTIDETQKKTRPVYQMTVAPRPYQQAPPPKTVYELPKGATEQTGAYGDRFFAVQSGDPRNNPKNYGAQYRRTGNQTYNVTTTRAQKAGDPEFDRRASEIARLQKRQRASSFAPTYTAPTLTSQNIYQQLGMAKDGGLKEDIKKIKSKKFSLGGKAAIRGTKFKGVF
jgi:hypothetical protein